MAYYLLVRMDKLEDIKDLIEVITREYGENSTIRAKMASGESLYYGFENAAENLNHIQMMYLDDEDE